MATGATSGGQIKTAGGIGKGWIALGAAAIGAGAIAAASGGGGGGGGGGSGSSAPASVTGNWNFSIRCQSVPSVTVISLDIPLNETAGGNFSGSGIGTDVNGDTLSFNISGNYNASTKFLSGQSDEENLTTMSQQRTDLFSTTLTSNDTGWIPLTRVSGTGCDGEIRMIKQ